MQLLQVCWGAEQSSTKSFGTYEHLSGVAVLQGQSWVADQVGQAVSTAQQASLGVVGKALLSALHGRLQGQGRGALWVILHVHNSNPVSMHARQQKTQPSQQSCHHDEMRLLTHMLVTMCASPAAAEVAVAVSYVLAENTVSVAQLYHVACRLL